MEEATTAIQERREQMLADAKPQDNPYVLVSNTVYPKVTIQIGRRQTLFHKELKGPPSESSNARWTTLPSLWPSTS